MSKPILTAGEPIYVREGSCAYRAVVQRIEEYGNVRPRIERPIAPEQLQSRDDCYALSELDRLVADLYDEADRAGREGRRIQSIIDEREMT